VDKDTIRICLERLNKEPECGVVGCRIKYPDGRFQMSAGNFPSFWRVCGLMLLSVSIIHDANRQNYEKSHKVDWVTGAFMLVSKKAIAATGGFDESFFMYGEEVEWQKRIWKAGYSVWYESGALIVHVGGGSHKDKYKVFLGEMAGYELWMKIYGNEMERFLLPVVINLGCLLRIVLFGVIGKSDMARTYLKVLFSRVSGKLG
jgi:GT2 family glycosyltransferase